MPTWIPDEDRRLGSQSDGVDESEGQVGGQTAHEAEGIGPQPLVTASQHRSCRGDEGGQKAHETDYTQDPQVDPYLQKDIVGVDGQQIAHDDPLEDALERGQKEIGIVKLGDEVVGVQTCPCEGVLGYQ